MEVGCQDVLVQAGLLASSLPSWHTEAKGLEVRRQAPWQSTSPPAKLLDPSVPPGGAGMSG